MTACSSTSDLSTLQQLAMTSQAPIATSLATNIYSVMLHPADTGYPPGGPEYIRLYPGLAWPFLLVAGTLAIVGTTGNVVIVLALWLNKKLRHRRNLFILNLALSDIIVTTVGDTFSVIGKT